MTEPRNIVRIDIDGRNTHGWQVRVTRHNERHTKFFSDSRYGSSEEARAAAQRFRDQIIADLPAPLNGAEIAARVRSTSGVPGIRLSFSAGIPLPRIEADMLLSGGVRKVRSFSVKKWGLRKALWKACVWKAEATPNLPSSSQHTQQIYETAYKTISKQLGGFAET
jgi:hypothetical protein